jgi:hypothetical protein
MAVFGLLAAVMLQAALAQSPCGSLQSTRRMMMFFGAVTVGGSPAPVGAVVAGYSPRGALVLCTVIGSDGKYGVVPAYGEEAVGAVVIPGMRTAESVQFRVNGVAATPSVVKGFANDWQNNTQHQVDLQAARPTPTRTATRVPPTATRVPATATRVPATATRVPATATRIPATATRIPATPTRVPATATRVPATATRVPATATRVPATATRVPATATRVPATATRVPATATRVPATATRTRTP